MRSKKRDYTPYVALTVLFALVVVALAPMIGDLTGYAIYDVAPTIHIIAIEDGAGADVIIAAADYARGMSISDVVLTSELDGTEEGVIILQNFDAEPTTISQNSENIIIEGDVALGLETLDIVLYNADYAPVSSLSIAADGTVTVLEKQSDIFDSFDEGPSDSIDQFISIENCEDTDGGIMSNELGTVTLLDGFDLTDSCWDEYTLIEMYCSQDAEGHEYIAETYIDCACAEGICISNEVVDPIVETDCVDSDGGDNPDVYGVLTGEDQYGNVIDQPDQCGSGTATVNDVFEKVCTDDGSYTYTQHTCEFGCLDGRCLTEEEGGPVCGDGVVDTSETCDDGNIVEGDGCSAVCLVENCIDTGTGVDVVYPGSSYDYKTGEYVDYEYHYDDQCYYYDYYGEYYYYDYYCEKSTYDGSWYATTRYPVEVCASGCEDGVGCVEVETVEAYCEDTDGGKDESVLGTTTNVNKFGEETVQTDECYSYNDNYHYVMEHYCYQGDTPYLYTDYILCDGACQDGVCVEGVEPTCEDSDGTDIYGDYTSSSFILGEVTGTNKLGEDFVNVDECYDSYGYQYVIEWYCYEDTYNDVVVPYSTYTYCQGGCEDGVCVEPDFEQSCIDSDETADNAGKNIHKKGSASGIDYYGNEYSYDDYCYEYQQYDYTTGQYETKVYVVDYYCADSVSWGSYASNYWDECSGGCADGACIIPEEEVDPTCSVVDDGVVGVDHYGEEYSNSNYCNGAAELVSYSCGRGSDGAPYVATSTACDCVDAMCHEASMTVTDARSLHLVIVIGATASTEDNIAAIDLAAATGWEVVTDTTINDFSIKNIVAIGGPYANGASKEVMGGEVWDYGPGEALFLVKEYEEGGLTLVISGSEAVDTRNAVKMFIDNSDALNYDYGVERVS
jgi:cysteine-rich repeat protein